MNADTDRWPTPGWFGPERQSALEDFFAVYEANSSDEVLEMRQVLRQAIAGDWAPYEEGLRRLGATYAKQNFTSWQSLMTLFSRRLIPVIVRAYPDAPERLAASLVVMQEFFDRVGETLRAAYVATMDETHRNDVIERERLESALRQSQKMEAIGSLAGGVAHDFNNLLSIILSYSDILAEDLRPDDPMRADLLHIHAAGMRAADLTRQLLAFSRQQVLQPKRVNLTDTVHGVEAMLRRVLGEDVELMVIASASLPFVTVDLGQIEQVILNLSVNARDAMPRGGTLTIETATVDLDATFAAAHVGVIPGRHVLLAFGDTGQGMDRATRARMFEPFFTTKEMGKGTGLGLSTVFGIVQQSAGTIWVSSEPGRGTRLELYFPIADSTVTDGS